jgi:hypothetical protein
VNVVKVASLLDIPWRVDIARVVRIAHLNDFKSKRTIKTPHTEFNTAFKKSATVGSCGLGSFPSLQSGSLLI